MVTEHLQPRLSSITFPIRISTPKISFSSSRRTHRSSNHAFENVYLAPEPSTCPPDGTLGCLTCCAKENDNETM